MFQILCRHCSSCRASRHADDSNSEYISCLGKPHAEAALTEMEYSHCMNMSLAFMQAQIALFSVPHYPLHPSVFFLPQTCEGKTTGQSSSVLGCERANASQTVLQVFQDKLLQVRKFKELCSPTDLALRATKATAQAIGRSMASLLVLEYHLWLNITEITEADKVPFVNSPVSPTSLPYVWIHRRVLCRMLYRCAEVFPGNATLLA